MAPPSPAPPVVLPALTQQTGVVIFLHNSGANGQSWAKRFESMPNMRLPYIKYIFPNAPVRPLTLYDGIQQTAWYDVHGFSNTAPVDEEGLAIATENLYRMIDEEMAKGTPSERILLAGYSLGGCLALYACLMSKNTLAGTVAVNSWLADYRMTASEKFQLANLRTPVLQLHGDNDPFVHLKYAHLSREIAKKGGCDYKLKIYKNSSHWPTPEMFEDMRKFIADRLPELKGEAESQSNANGSGT